MSESNGTVRPAGGTYRRAVERHRAERAAWDRVRVARIELAAAVADYELCWQGCPLPPGRPLMGSIGELPDDERDDKEMINGLVELPESEMLPLGELNRLRTDLPEITPDDVDRFAALTPKEREAEIRPELEAIGRRVAEEEAAELPAGGGPPRPKRSKLDHQLADALHRSEGAKERWNNRRIAGLDDAALKEAIGQEFGSGGGRLGGEYDYYVKGLSKPRIYLGAAKEASLSGAKLVDRVRILMEIPRPVPPPAQRAGFAETDVILPTLEDTLAAEADAEADGLPPWTGQDLEDELLYALSSGGLAAELAWGALIRGGATNDEINQHLGAIWPRARRFTPPSVSGGRKLGHTIVYGTSQPCFWLGKMDGPGHKPTLANSALIDRIRAVLEIPTPTEARKRAQASFSDAAAWQGIPLREPTIAAVDQPARPVKRAIRGGVQSGQDLGISAPAAGWDDMSLRVAADDLGIAFSDLAICDKCDAARARDCHPCPRYGCGHPNYRLTDSQAVWGAPAYQPRVRRKAAVHAADAELPVETERPVKRGRGRPPGAKTRKPAAAVE